jgi:hypothetical protein
MEERDSGSEFLPPEPAGPEPDLDAPPPKQEPPPPPPPPQQPQQQPQQPPQQTYGYPPPPGQPYHQPPPGYGQPPPGQPPPGYPPPGQGYPPQWGYAQPPVPDNGQAVGGFVFSLVSLGLLVISFGLSSIVSLGCSIAGIIMGRNGKRKVDRGETPKHRGLAQAGFIIGWVSLALSILATIGWILFIVLAATDDDFNWEDYESASVPAAILAASWRILM